MVTLSRILPLGLVFFTALYLSSAQAQSSYSLGAGDLIRISVFEEKDLSFDELLVGDRGVVSYPFLGEITVKGLSTKQLEQKIIDGLIGDYLINPRVTVAIMEYRKFYVNGEVEKPGGFAFQPGLSVRQAISLAGGFTDRASKTNIFIVQDDDPEQTSNQVSLNSPVTPGDSVTVEQSFF